MDERGGAAAAPGPVVLFDGVCSFCSRAASFVLRRDGRGQFRFAALQSAAGRRLLAAHGLPFDRLDTLVLVDGPHCWTRSAAALEILRRLGGVWSAASVLRVLPRPLRDAAYDWFAQHRYRWFPRREVCYRPTAEERDRFLE